MAPENSLTRLIKGETSKTETTNAVPTISSIDTLDNTLNSRGVSSIHTAPTMARNLQSETSVDTSGDDAKAIHNSEVLNRVLELEKDAYKKGRYRRSALRNQRSELWNQVARFVSVLSEHYVKHNLDASPTLSHSFHRISQLHDRYGVLEDQYNASEDSMDRELGRLQAKLQGIHRKSRVDSKESVFGEQIGLLTGTGDVTTTEGSAPDSITHQYMQDIESIRLLQEYFHKTAHIRYFTDIRNEARTVIDRFLHDGASTSDTDPYSENLVSTYDHEEHRSASLISQNKEDAQRLRTGLLLLGIDPDKETDVTRLYFRAQDAGIDFHDSFPEIEFPISGPGDAHRKPLLFPLNLPGIELLDRDVDPPNESKSDTGIAIDDPFLRMPPYDNYSGRIKSINKWMLHILRGSRLQLVLYALELGFWGIHLDDDIAKRVLEHWYDDETTMESWRPRNPSTTPNSDVGWSAFDNLVEVQGINDEMQDSHSASGSAARLPTTVRGASPKTRKFSSIKSSDRNQPQSPTFLYDFKSTSSVSGQEFPPIWGIDEENLPVIGADDVAFLPHRSRRPRSM